jgi:hypothetical protein
MMQRRLVEHLWPKEVAHRALTTGRRNFALAYDDTQLLLVRLTHQSGELTEGLVATVSSDNDQPAPRPLLPTTDFHTEVVSDGEASAVFEQRSDFNAAALSERLSQALHFVVPLRKRANADMIYVDRISVGRARNKDIVLRDATVSKFHGWFQLNQAREFCFADAGSKNRTRVNGDLLEPRALAQLKPGDMIKFGSVEAILCTAEMVWDSLRSSPASAQKSGI